MSLALVLLKDLFNFKIHRFVYSSQILRNILVDCTLADTEPLRRNPYGRLVLDNICSEDGTPFLAGGYVHHSVKPPLIQFF